MKKLILIVFLICITGSPQPVFAISQKEKEKYNQIKLCIYKAANYYHVSEKLLTAIAWVESRLGENTQHTNKSDFGVMGVNRQWFGFLEKHGVDVQKVKSDICSNIFVGAWILKNNLNRYGNTWYAVGVYNAGTSKKEKIERKRRKYANLVYQYIHTSQ